ncbi:MAG: LURP-one-related family protein [Acutalibacteraceae bacterium]|nr:LURP-one-related family protein [Acutalibacteraceae bacterium]
MKLIFKQNMFSWFDSYDIFDEQGNTVYTVKGQLAWGHCFKIFDRHGEEIGGVRQKILSFLPRYEMFVGANSVGFIKKEFTFLRPRFTVDFRGWQMEGNLFEWDYCIVNSVGDPIAKITKQFLNFTDTYVIDVLRSEDALYALMLVIAIDADKCSRED